MGVQKRKTAALIVMQNNTNGQYNFFLSFLGWNVFMRFPSLSQDECF